MSAFRFASLSDHSAPLLATSLAGRTFVEFLIIGGAAIVVAGGVLIWVLAFRPARKRTRIYRHHHHSTTDPSLSESAEETRPDSRRGRQRRKRPRNPTLAESGGLPPVRPPQNPPTEFPY